MKVMGKHSDDEARPQGRQGSQGSLLRPFPHSASRRPRAQPVTSHTGFKLRDVLVGGAVEIKNLVVN